MQETAIERLARRGAAETGQTGTPLMIEASERAALQCKERDIPTAAYMCRMQAASLRGQARIRADGTIEWILPDAEKPLIDEMFEGAAAACGVPL